MDKFTKQGYEKFAVEFDFSENMGDLELISTQTVVATDVNGLDVSATVVSNVQNDGAQSVLCMVQAGEEGSSPYKLTAKTITDISHQWEKDVQMKIKEI